MNSIVITFLAHASLAPAAAQGSDTSLVWGVPVTVLIVALWVIGTTAATCRSLFKSGSKAKIFDLLYLIVVAPTIVVCTINIGLNTATLILLSLGCVFGPITGYIAVHYYNCKRAWQLAPALHTWLSANFALLDTDEDGLVTRDDLERFWETAKAAERYHGAPVTAARTNDREMAGHASYFLCDIGHVIKTVLVGSPMHGVVTGVKIYAISQADVESFPEKALLRYQREFPRG